MPKGAPGLQRNVHRWPVVANGDGERLDDSLGTRMVLPAKVLSISTICLQFRTLGLHET